MVNREQFEEICNKYGLDSKKLIKNNENVLEKTDYNSICYVLDFLRDTLKVSPNNIEKCPSILYLKIEAIKENWNFLNEKKINTRDVETCLHILSTEPEQLKKTYEYVSAENRYGKKYIEQITTILRVSVERIQEIEEKCPEYLGEFDKLHKRTSAHMFNMFIMKKEILDEYCTWLFDILFELEKRTDASKYDSFHARFYGRISELLLDVWVNKNKIKYEEVKVMDMQNVNWLKKGTSFLNAKFTGKKYGKSF